MNIQTCTTIDQFINGLDTFLHPEPSKRQKINGPLEYRRLETQPLDSFLNANSQWLPLARANPILRQKFRDLALHFETGTHTRQRNSLGKRLREEGRPQLPPEMFQEILNIASYDNPSELVQNFRKTLTVATSWDSLSQHALITKINAEGLSISSLQIQGGLEAEIRFILSCGAKLTHLDLHDRTVTANDLLQIFDRCRNLATLKINAPEIQTWEGALDTISNLTRLETFHALFDSLENFHLPGEMPALKSLNLIIRRIERFTLPEQIETLYLNIKARVSLELPALPQLKALNLTLPLAYSLNLPKYPRLDILRVSANALQLLHVPLLPSLRTCVINSRDLRRLELCKQPSLEHLELDIDRVTALQIPPLPALRTLILAMPGLQELTLGNCAQLSHFDLYAADLSMFPSHSLPDSLRLLSLSLPAITALTLQTLPGLYVCEIHAQQLSNLTLDGLPALNSLTLKTPALETLQLEKLPSLESLEVESPCLSFLSFDAVFDSLEFIEISSERLQTFHCPICPNLGRIDLKSNNLSSFHLPALPKLEELYLALDTRTAEAFDTPALMELILPPLPELTHLTIKSTQLRSLRHPHFPLMEELLFDCSHADFLDEEVDAEVQ